MKREIRFNAWIPELELMIEDVKVGQGTIGFASDSEEIELALNAKGYSSEDYNLPADWYDTGEEWYHVMGGFELVQFTGLKDSVGNEIDEGAILKRHEGYLMTVSYHLDGFVADGINEIHHTPLYSVAYESKIIGNIYENPELLEALNN